MRVSDLVKNSVVGELRQVSINDIGTGGSRTPAQQANVDALVAFVNQAILDLSTRFPLFTIVEELDATANDTDPVAFPVNAISLIKLVDGLNRPIDINEPMYQDELYKNLDAWYVFTPSVNTLTIHNNKPVANTTLYGTFSCTPAVTYSYTSNIPIPAYFMQPILDFMAYKATTANKPLPNQEGNTYYAKYKMGCEELAAKYDFGYNNTYNTKLFDRGFV